MQRTILVTGASRGIGRATAELLLNQGDIVHGTFLTGVEEAEHLSSTYEHLTMHRVDFAGEGGVDDLVSSLGQVSLDGLVNNAGAFDPDGFDDWDYATWRRLFAINLESPLRLTMQLRPTFNRHASVVNVASLDGMIGSFHSMAYSASKAALINVTKSLANNFGPSAVRVNAIAPGWIDTAMSTPESMMATQLTPLGRNGTPGEVAGLIEFLLGQNSSFITGATIIVDGGIANVDYIMLQEAKGRSPGSDA